MGGWPHCPGQFLPVVASSPQGLNQQLAAWLSILRCDLCKPRAWLAFCCFHLRVAQEDNQTLERYHG